MQFCHNADLSTDIISGSIEVLRQREDPIKGRYVAAKRAPYSHQLLFSSSSSSVHEWISRLDPLFLNSCMNSMDKEHSESIEEKYNWHLRDLSHWWFAWHLKSPKHLKIQILWAATFPLLYRSLHANEITTTLSDCRERHERGTTNCTWQRGRDWDRERSSTTWPFYCRRQRYFAGTWWALSNAFLFVFSWLLTSSVFDTHWKISWIFR